MNPAPPQTLIGSYARGRWWMHPQVFTRLMVIDGIDVSILPQRFTPTWLMRWVVIHGLLQLELLHGGRSIMPVECPTWAAGNHPPLYNPIVAQEDSGWNGRVQFMHWPTRFLVWMLPACVLPVISVHLVEQPLTEKDYAIESILAHLESR